MKTAISLPDEVFDQAERLAKQFKVPRSELYSRALQEFIARHAPDRVTDALDAVCDALDEAQDPFVAKAAKQVLERDEW